MKALISGAPLAVFCSASTHLDNSFYTLAYETGVFLSTKGMPVLFGGDNQGMMKTLAQGVLETHGQLQAVMPENFAFSNQGVPDIPIVMVPHLS